ncbi:winged helix-turn-helix domain-containing protein [Nocardioidaceae bacterium]|nr:winged helix-turn-helix domain-containing protein [Nocardioidaceae bacterium]
MGRIRLFGLTRVDSGTSTIVGFPSVKSRQLLELLALTPGIPVDKARLAENLWDGDPPPSFAGSLESHVCRLRRLMSEAGWTSAIVTVAGGYVLDPGVPVDVAVAREVLAGSLDLTPPRACLRVAAIAPPPSATLLASSPFSAYAEEARADLASMMSTAMRRACAGALSLGDGDLAVWLGRRALQEEPLCDANALALMRAMTAAGATCEAFRVYADFRDRVRDELGVEPGADVQRFYLAELQRNDRDRATVAPVERALLRRLLSSTGPSGG